MRHRRPSAAARKHVITGRGFAVWHEFKRHGLLPPGRQNLQRVRIGGAAFGMSTNPEGVFILASESPAFEVVAPRNRRFDVAEYDADHVRLDVLQLARFLERFESVAVYLTH